MREHHTFGIYTHTLSAICKVCMYVRDGSIYATPDNCTSMCGRGCGFPMPMRVVLVARPDNELHKSGFVAYILRCLNVLCELHKQQVSTQL